MSENSNAVRTTIIHRRSTARAPWWHTATISEIPGVIDPRGAKMLQETVFSIARMGFTAVLFRPALMDFNRDLETLTELITAIHRVGLKAIVRLSGADHAPTKEAEEPAAFFGFEQSTANLVVRARLALKAGADGIDLGRIEDTPVAAGSDSQSQRFTELTRILLAELADFSPDHILSAEAVAYYDDSLQRHLHEEWFHHLRDDRLAFVGFDADAILEEVSLTITERDQLGAVCAWRTMLPRLMGTPGVKRSYAGSWEEDADDARRAAMRLVLCSLPGAIYLPFAFSGGRAEFEGPAARVSAASTEAELERHRHTTLALRIRNERRLATGTFASVSGLPWLRRGVQAVMSGSMLAVLNTSDGPITVPPQYQLLLRSDSSRPQDNPAVMMEKNLAGGSFAEPDLKQAHAVGGESAQDAGTQLPSGASAWFLPPVVNA
ncbi:MAG: hypothetical protein Q4P06_00305 [Actinomycetaceae bacterium]|nr:hypothetical protein [Actinomycetaceae bacterium]